MSLNISDKPEEEREKINVALHFTSGINPVDQRKEK